MPALRPLEKLSSSGEPVHALLFTYIAAVTWNPTMLGHFWSWKKLEKTDLFFWGPEICQGIATFLYHGIVTTHSNFQHAFPPKKTFAPNFKLPVSSVGIFTFAATTGHQIPAPWIKILHLLWVEPASGGIWSTFFSVAKPLRHCLC